MAQSDLRDGQIKRATNPIEEYVNRAQRHRSESGGDGEKTTVPIGGKECEGAHILKCPNQNTLTRAVGNAFNWQWNVGNNRGEAANNPSRTDH